MRRKAISKYTVVLKLFCLFPLVLLAGKWGREDIWCTQHTLFLISRFEGFFPKAYICPAGCSTIGYGHVLEPHESDLIHVELTQYQANELLKLDLIKGNDIRPYLYNPEALEPHQLDAITSLTFNMGHPEIGYSRLIKHINENKIELACDFFAPWRKIEEAVFPGLAKRRLAELMIFANRAFDPKSNLLPSDQWGVSLKYTDESWSMLRKIDIESGSNLIEEAVKIFYEYQRYKAILPTKVKICD